MKKIIRYGGSSCNDQEYKAIMKSVKNSIISGGWQASSEAKKMEAEASKGSEVIISAVTFPTIFNVILQCGLVPVVVDAKVGTYNFDVKEVLQAITPKTRAIIAIHALGNPVDMPELMKLVKVCNKPRGKDKIYVIEDNCDGWGSTIKNNKGFAQKVGSFGDISITSFHAAHIVSMGVGGGVFTSSKEIAKKVRMYRDWGRQADVSKKTNGKKWETLPEDYDSRFIYEKIGYNFQILELQAAMGRVQLQKAEKIKKMRKKNFDYLVKHLSKHGALFMPEIIKGADVCWFSLPLTYIGDRGKLLDHLEKNGIETRSLFAGQIHKHPAYENSKYRLSGNLQESEYILKHSFWISVHPRNTKADNDYIIKTFNDFFKTKNT